MSRGKGALSSLFAVEEGKELSSALRKAVQDIHHRLGMLTSGHEGCPLPETAQESGNLVVHASAWSLGFLTS